MKENEKQDWMLFSERARSIVFGSDLIGLLMRGKGEKNDGKSQCEGIRSLSKEERTCKTSDE